MRAVHGATPEDVGALAPLRRWVMALRGPGAGAAAFLGGAASALAHAPFHAWPVMILAVTMLVWLLDGAVMQARPGRAGFWRSWAFATGYFLAGLWWLANAFIARGPEFAPWAPVGVLAAGAGLALFWGVAGMAAAWLWRSDWRRIILFATLFGLAEYLRGHLLSGFPWNAPGYVWPASWPMAQASAVLGVHGLGVLTLFAFAAPAALGGPDRAPSQRAAPFLAAIAIFTVLVAGGFARLGGASDANVGDVRLRIVQSQISQRDKWAPENRDAILERYLDLTTRPGLETRTHVVWPESALPILLMEQPRTLDAIARRVGPDRVLMTGVIRRDMANPLEPVHHNSFVVMPIEDGRPNLAEASVYDKRKLVPFGEFIPLHGLLDRVIGSTLVNLGGSYSPGPGAATIAVRGAPAAAPQICYETVFPGFTPRGADRPGWIINVSNDSWFGTWVGPEQAFIQARYRAIEEGVPVVRAASGGVSGIVDAYGRVRSRLSADEENVLDDSLPAALRPTLYALVGDAGFVFLIVAGFALAFGNVGPSASRPR